MTHTVLRLPAVKATTGLSRSTIYLRVAESTFPKPVSLGGRAVGWLQDEIQEWLQWRIDASRKVKRGLPTSDRQRPLLILGRDLAAFLQARRLKNKRTCQAGEIYCVRCHLPRNPAGDMAEYQPVTAVVGNLVGICPNCESMMFRLVSLAKLEQVRGKLEIR